MVENGVTLVLGDNFGECIFLSTTGMGPVGRGLSQEEGFGRVAAQASWASLVEVLVGGGGDGADSGAGGGDGSEGGGVGGLAPFFGRSGFPLTILVSSP